jgi:hypothetical protein
MSRLIQANAPLVFELADALLVLERASWPCPAVRTALTAPAFRTKPRENAVQEYLANVELWSQAQKGLRVFWKDTSQRYLGLSQTFTKEAGFANPALLVGKMDTDEDMPWSRQGAKYMADDRRVMLEGAPKFDILERLDATDERTLWLRTSKAPVFQRGLVVATIGAFEVISLEMAKAIERSRSNG